MTSELKFDVNTNLDEVNRILIIIYIIPMIYLKWWTDYKFKHLFDECNSQNVLYLHKASYIENRINIK